MFKKSLLATCQMEWRLNFNLKNVWISSKKSLQLSCGSYPAAIWMGPIVFCSILKLKHPWKPTPRHVTSHICNIYFWLLIADHSRFGLFIAWIIATASWAAVVTQLLYGLAPFIFVSIFELSTHKNIPLDTSQAISATYTSDCW